MLIGPAPPPSPTPIRLQQVQIAVGDAYVGRAQTAKIQKPSVLLEWSQRQALARGLLDKPAEYPQLVRSLSRIDSALLRLARDHGVTIGVVTPGQDIFQLGALQSRSLQEYEAALPAMRQQAEQAVASLPHDQLDTVLDGTGLGAIRFTVPLSSVEALEPKAAEQISLAGKPKTLAQMAALVGARTAEEVREYSRLLEALNGQRMQQAREGRTEADPPLNLEKHNIVVPNLFYVRGHRLDLNDASSFKNFAGADGLTLARNSETNPEGTFVDGQYFPATHRLLVQSEAIATKDDTGHGDTVLHEFGHALEMVVARVDPDFYRPWQERVQAAHQAATSSVSEYALTNPHEYVAEGLAHFFDNPQQLKSQDVKLFELTQEFVQHVRQR